MWSIKNLPTTKFRWNWIFLTRKLLKISVPFYVTVTNLATGKAEYHKVDNVFEQMELLRASSALPLASKIVEWQSNKYLDGGLSDSIPVDLPKALVLIN